MGSIVARRLLTSRVRVLLAIATVAAGSASIVVTPPIASATHQPTQYTEARYFQGYLSVGEGAASAVDSCNYRYDTYSLGASGIYKTLAVIKASTGSWLASTRSTSDYIEVMISPPDLAGFGNRSYCKNSNPPDQPVTIWLNCYWGSAAPDNAGCV